MNILVTGGSSGLGRAVVEELAKEDGNIIYFTYFSNLTAVNELTTKYQNTSAIRVDFTDSQAVSVFSKSLEQKNIDILVNNAYSGTAQGKRFHQTEKEDYVKAFNENIIPFIQITQACLRGMRKRKFGKIVNIITSSLIDVPPIGYSVYASTKAYLRQLSKSISKEYARFGITANCIFPDNMATAFGKVSDFQMEQMLENHPLKRLLETNEAAEIVVGVIHATQHLNGAEIPINAAQHIM